MSATALTCAMFAPAPHEWSAAERRAVQDYYDARAPGKRPSEPGAPLSMDALRDADMFHAEPVPTAENLADFLTKIFPRSSVFVAMRDKLMVRRSFT